MGSGYTDRQERVVTWYERICKAWQVGDSNCMVFICSSACSGFGGSRGLIYKYYLQHLINNYL